MNFTPRWKPISHLPVFACSVDGWVENLQEQYKTILPTKDRPHSMDDYTIGLIFEVIGKQKDDLWMWEEQLSRWEKLDLDRKQQSEFKRLKGQNALIKNLIESILALAEELKDHTIEKVMAKEYGYRIKYRLKTLIGFPSYKAILSILYRY